MSCTLTPGSADAGGALELEVTCRASNAPADPSVSADLDATLSLAASSVSGSLRRLALPGPEMLHDLAIAPSPLHHEGTHWRAQLELREASVAP